MKAKKKKVNRQDATLRNVRAARKRESKLYLKVLALLARHTRFKLNLIDILKSKRLLTPAQVKMLEDALR